MWDALDDDCVSLIAWELVLDDAATFCTLRGVSRRMRGAVETVLLQDQGADTKRLFREGYGVILNGRTAVVHYALRRLKSLHGSAYRGDFLKYVCGRCGKPTHELLACKCHLDPPSPVVPAPSPPPLRIDSYPSAWMVQYRIPPLSSTLPLLYLIFFVEAFREHDS